MKTKLTFLLLIIFSFTSFSQEKPSVEKSIFGVQTGIFGLWVHNESKLTNSIALRTEIGLDFGFSSSSNIITGKTETIFLGAPMISVQPKWYYNLEKREKKGKRIDGNSGNFFSLNIYYHSDLFIISNKDNIELIPDLSIVPTWGIRRNIGQHFNYETYIGIGYQYLFEKNVGYTENKSQATVSLGFKIGYKF